MFSNMLQATSNERLLIPAKLLTSIRIFLLFTKVAALPRIAQLVSKVLAEIARYRIGFFWQSSNGSMASIREWNLVQQYALTRKATPIATTLSQHLFRSFFARLA